METVVWLWLYDRRWVFNVKAPCSLKIWTLPLIINAVFLTSLFNYSRNRDQCYSHFETWIYVRAAIICLVFVGLLLIFKETTYSAITEKNKMVNYKASILPTCKNHNFWVTRNALTSYPGLFLLALSLINWIWSLYGLSLAYKGYKNDGFIGCGSAVKNVVSANILPSAICSIPMVLGVFLILALKGTVVLMGAFCPQTLIWIKRKTSVERYI